MLGQIRTALETFLDLLETNQPTEFIGGEIITAPVPDPNYQLVFGDLHS